jgi:hypothetical protein
MLSIFGVSIVLHFIGDSAQTRWNIIDFTALIRKHIEASYFCRYKQDHLKLKHSINPHTCTSAQ